MTGQAIVIQGNALSLPLPDNSVDLIVTSPPYFALRSYQDAGEHYEGQIGSEPTPQDFLEALWAATEEMVRVIKPGGSIFVNLGDKYAGSGGHNNAGLSPQDSSGQMAGRGITKGRGATRRQAPDRYNQATGGIRAKSLMGFPWRYAIGCVDRLGLILREEIIWSKRSALPESVRDRARRTHEQWFHFVKSPIYFSGMDELREPHIWGSPNGPISSPYGQGFSRRTAEHRLNGQALPPQPGDPAAFHPLGKLPGSVWEMTSEPLRIPEYAIEDERGWRMFGRVCMKEKDKLAVRKALWNYALKRFKEGCTYLRIFEPDHFAAFPTEWPRRLIEGFAPSRICTVCGQGRFPVVDKEAVGKDRTGRGAIGNTASRESHGLKSVDRQPWAENVQVAIVGYACACAPDSPPSRLAVVLDPFGGTGTTALVARVLGRIGITIDLSMDYCRLAKWRIYESGHGQKALERSQASRQGSML